MKKVTLFVVLATIMAGTLFAQANSSGNMVDCYSDYYCINKGDSITLRANLHHNFTAQVTYQWQEFQTDHFVDIVGANDKKYTTANPGVYRVQITEHGQCSNNGKSFYSPPFVVSYCGSSLPVTLINFDGIIKDQKVILHWTTSQEINLDRFEIEKSYDLKSFVTVDTIKTTGNSAIKKNYTAEDLLRASDNTIYYRLRMVDKDEKITFSEVIPMHINGQQQSTIVKVYPNPIIGGVINLQFYDNISEHDIKLFDATGRMINEWRGFNGNGYVTAGNLIPGIYFIKINGQNSQKIMVSK